jgi:predicted ATPase
MPLRRLAVQNYRCFRDRQEIEIHPVTVILGKNNSGKSALVRAPLVFETGFDADTSAPLDLERLAVDPVDAFTDLIFEQRPHGSIGIGIDVDDEFSFSLTATVQNVSETHEAFVTKWRVQFADTDVSLEWQPDLLASPPRTYEVLVDGVRTRQATVNFRGLLPDELPDLSRRIPGFSMGTLRYLSPYRERLRRQHRLPLGAPQTLGAEGQGVAAVLADDRARGHGALIDTVNSYLRHLVPDWELEEVEAGPLWATVLRRRSGGGVQVNLVDAGAGLAQVLPILVQCAMDEQEGGRADPPLQIIEEPEMHLHPAAHAELADLYLRTAKATGTRFLLETHSETLLLRLRRRIAEGDYPADMVGVYVVEQHDGVSTVRRVDIDAMGNLSDEWPEGYFSTDYHDVRALAAAQLRRGGHAA